VLQHIVEGLRDAGYAIVLLWLVIALMLCRIFSATVRATTSPFSIRRRRCKMGPTAWWSSLTISSLIIHSCLAYGAFLVDPANYKRLVDLPDDVEAMLTVTRGEDVSKGGAVFLNDEMDLIDLREKPKPGEPTTLVNARALRVSAKHFRFHRKIETVPTRRIRTDRCDRELAQSGKEVKALELSGEWADVRDPEILARLNSKLEGVCARRDPMTRGVSQKRLQLFQSDWFLDPLQVLEARVAAQRDPERMETKFAVA